MADTPGDGVQPLLVTASLGPSPIGLGGGPPQSDEAPPKERNFRGAAASCRTSPKAMSSLSRASSHALRPSQLSNSGQSDVEPFTLEEVCAPRYPAVSGKTQLSK